MVPYLKQKQHALAALTDRIRQAVYTPLGDLRVTAWVTPEPVPYTERESGRRMDLAPGEAWGKLFDCAWFHFTGRVPEEAAGHPVVLLIDINGEACIVDEHGAPVLGLTTVNSEYDFSLGRPGKRVVSFLERAVGGEEVNLWAEAGCNDLFGRLPDGGTLKEARIAVCHPDLRGLFYDWEVLHELLGQLPEDSARRHRLWAALRRAALALDHFTEEEARKARAVLAPELAKRGGDPSLVVSAVGHAHIDLAWLWPLRETIRKGARTFATALHLMDRYPDYVFGASQPQLYAWMKERYPHLYDRIRDRVAEGRWEPQGAMWVEADANLPGGESLVRQVLYGKRFFRAEFGRDVTNLWLPDVFGYSGALPQIMKKAGVKYFMTQKLSWSQVNTYPHHTFLWEGIDGTQVLAHLPPEDTYNSSAAPRAVVKAERNFADKAVSDRCLLLFGIGDGGGGPGEEHLERLAREKNLAGLCPVEQEPAERFFARLERDRPYLSVWAGELYLERHQGTYTTQGRSKRANRRMEMALREAEWAASRAVRSGRAYPATELEAVWKEMLLYQFHDILPGSSITRVYTESLERYAALLEQTERLAREAEKAYFDEVETADMRRPVIVSNSLSWERTEFVEIGGSWRRVTIPPLGYTAVDLEADAPAWTAPAASPERLENECLRVDFNSDGSVRSVWDKEHGREALAPGTAGNRLAVYHDPGDAWDFPMDYAERAPEHIRLCSAQARVEGPRAILSHVYAFGQSTLLQEVVLIAESRRLDFRTEVDWQEAGRMLRTSFPVAVHAEAATCEIQFGSIRRATGQNTSWDEAKTEVCAHRWVDLSERGYGVALLNNGKYGHRVTGGVLDLNLLRSPGYPDPQADRGRHEFTYSLYPHLGDHVEGGVLQAGFALNVPLCVTPVQAHPGARPSRGSFLQVDAPGVIVEAVKKAEDGDDLIVRLYEAHGASVRAMLRFEEGVCAAALVDLMEENPQPLAIHDGGLLLAFRPFEIHTLRLAMR